MDLEILMNVINDVKVIWFVRQEYIDAIKENKMNSIVTPGWKTSEFWMHLLAQLPAVAGLFLGASNPVVIGLACAANLGASIYTACRSNVKMSALVPLALSTANAATDLLNKASSAPVGPVQP